MIVLVVRIAQALDWDRGRLARNAPSGADSQPQTCSRFALIAGETPAVPVFAFECTHLVKAREWVPQSSAVHEPHRSRNEHEPFSS